MQQTAGKGFTLVELIVVVTILAILGTIGFVSYSGYLVGVRDTNRTSQLSAISDGLELYAATKTLPLPDNYVTITSDGTTIVGYQGYAGVNVLETIGYSKGGKDPKDKTYFTYYLTADKKHHQLMAYLEKSANLQTSIFQNTYAADYSDRFPTVYGKKLGILTQTGTNSPIQDDGVSVVDLSNLGATAYVAHFKDSEATISGTGLTAIAPNANCKRIFDVKGKRKDGIYSINPTGSSKFDVYCDMTTDGGGWTYTTMKASSFLNLFKTSNTNKITSITSDISTKGQISDIWADNGDKDIMIHCSLTSVDHKTYETPYIIYSYKKDDINHLEKDIKQSTTFSSSKLQAKWNGNKFTLRTTYGFSSNDGAFYPLEDVTGKVTFYTTTGLGNGTNAYQYSPAYISSGPTWISLNSTNYCMTAIR